MSPITHRCTAHAKRCRDPRQTGVIDQAFFPDVRKWLADRIQCLAPRDRDESGILITPLAGIGAPHGRQHTIGIVGFLNGAIGLDATSAVGGVHPLGIKIGQNLARDTVLYRNFHQARACDAVIAIRRNRPDVVLLFHIAALDLPTPPLYDSGCVIRYVIHANRNTFVSQWSSMGN